MNLAAFILVVVAGALAIAALVQTAGRSLIGWAVLCLSVGVILQEVFTAWSHSVHA